MVFYRHAGNPNRVLPVQRLEHQQVVPMVTRYALTHIDNDGLRRLTFANQGRNHHKTPQVAERARQAVLENNSPDKLRQIFGRAFIPTVRVDPIECYDHGDATQTVFSNSKLYSATFTGRPTFTEDKPRKVETFSEGETEEEARQMLDHRFEQIQNLVLKQIA